MSSKRELLLQLRCLKLGMTYVGTFNEKETQTLKHWRELLRFGLKCLRHLHRFICEELWSQTSEKGFISVAPGQYLKKQKLNIAAEEQENLIIDVMSDTSNILKAMKIIA